MCVCVFKIVCCVVCVDACVRVCFYSRFNVVSLHGDAAINSLKSGQSFQKRLGLKATA